MMIDYQRYSPNTLKKDRQQAFKTDILNVYEEYYLKLGPTCFMLSIQQFNEKVWTKSQIQFLEKCRSEEQQQEEYLQLLYQVVISMCLSNQENYGLQQCKLKKVFGIFLLYFFYNCTHFPRKISINSQFLDDLISFTSKNKGDKTLGYFRIIPKLLNCFIYGIKLGIRNPLINFEDEKSKKKNKGKEKNEELIKSDYMKNFYTELPQLENVCNYYQQLKKNERENSPYRSIGLNETDKYFPHRIKNLLDNYENELQRSKRK